jgi:hypothetical protein
MERRSNVCRHACEPMTKVYVVTQGEYSDYSIEAVTLDRKVAKAIVERISGAKTRVETYDLYDKDSSLAPITYYRVYVDKDGNETRRWITTHHPWDDMVQETWGNRQVGFGAASARGFDVALKAARDKAYKEQAKRAGVADL